MSNNNKVVWSEGMFLRHQHFQQQTRYFESQLTEKVNLLSPYGWGLQELTLDKGLLGTGRIALEKCRGVFPDGTFFSLPDECEAPPVLEVPENTHNCTIYLGIPVKRAGAQEINVNQKSAGFTRFAAREYEIRDNVSERGAPAIIHVAQLQLKFLLEEDDRNQFVCLPIARILQRHSNGLITLDESFMPTCLDAQAYDRLIGYAHELRALLHQRGENLSKHVGDPSHNTIANMTDFLMLQLINRYEPLFHHLCEAKSVHPEQLYTLALQLNGEMAVYAEDSRRPVDLPIYNHQHPERCFDPLMKSLRKALSLVLEQTALQLDLQENTNGIRVATLADRNLLKSSSFVLAVNADIPSETLRQRFPSQVKIGPVEQIRQLINLQLPGITVNALPIAPPQIPFHAGFIYFELDKHSSIWDEMTGSGGFAIHIGGEFPGTELSFWAIRGKS